MTGISRSSKALLLVLVIFLLSVCARIPQLARPLSHHHEAIPALELVTIASWKQAGGPAPFNYIPVFNYQQPGDKQLANNYNIDKNGNEIYISYGTGWNLLPYYSFALLHIAPTPLALRVLNICIGLVSCLFLFRLMLLVSESESNKYSIAVIACTAFIFTPGTLWYLGNVYTNCSLAVPFIIAFLYCLTRMILHPTAIRVYNILLLFLLVICLLSIDWVGVFLAFTSTVLLLFKVKRNRRLAYPLAAIILGVIAGLGLIAWQFVSYLGPDMVRNNLTSKFMIRSLRPAEGLLHPVTSIATHFVTASLPVIGLLAAAWLAAVIYKKRIQAAGNTRLLYIILLPALVLYNLCFLSWTRIHEFSILYYAILFAVAAGSLLPQVWTPQKITMALIALISLTVVEYHLVNPPGSKSLNGEAYNVYRQLGEAIAAKTTPGQAVFINLTMLPPTMYYAKRSINYAASLEQAKKLLSNYRTSEGVWVQQNEFRIIRVEFFHK